MKKADLIIDSQASDFFRLPRSTAAFTGCVYDTPVKFLESDYRSFCPTTIVRSYILYFISRLVIILYFFSLLKNACEINTNFDAATFNKGILFTNPASASGKIRIESGQIEYYVCDDPFSGSTASTTPNAQLNCDISRTETCAFNINTKLFDNNLTSDICPDDTWTYNPSRVNNKVTTDYYLRPDTVNNCQVANSALRPTQTGSVVNMLLFFCCFFAL